MSSAPGEALLSSLRGTHRIISGIRQDAVTRTTVSEIAWDVARACAMVSDIHPTGVRGQEEISSNKPPVSDSQVLVITEQPLTIPQTQARSAIQSSIVCFLTS